MSLSEPMVPTEPWLGTPALPHTARNAGPCLLDLQKRKCATLPNGQGLPKACSQACPLTLTPDTLPQALWQARAPVSAAGGAPVALRPRDMCHPDCMLTRTLAADVTRLNLWSPTEPWLGTPALPHTARSAPLAAPAAKLLRTNPSGNAQPCQLHHKNIASVSTGEYIHLAN
jgi:hypothetical protein